MVPRSRIARLKRMTTHTPDRRTLFFVVYAGRRNEYLTPDAVPDFEGEEAWFELERVKGPIWMTWKVIRQVEPPNGGR